MVSDILDDLSEIQRAKTLDIRAGCLDMRVLSADDRIVVACSDGSIANISISSEHIDYFCLLPDEKHLLLCLDW